ncbi:autotransporter domain-containing protein [Rhizobium sp. XQZ8]|nr:autotransporter domain-containing protein [Rhizobium populisoli]
MVEAGFARAKKRLRLYSALVSLTVALPVTASAQSTWTGAGSSDFSDGANWDTAPAAPGASDAAIIQSGTPIASSDAEVKSLDVSGGTLKVGADLTATGGTKVFDMGRLEVSTGGELISDVTLTGGHLGVSGTLTGDVDASGGTFINDGTIDGEANIRGGTLNNNGKLRDLAITSGGIVTNNATATVTGQTNVTNGTLTSNGTLGAVDIGTAGTFTNNTGAKAGAVTNAGTASNSGTVILLVNNAGSFTNNAGGVVTGTTTVTGGTVANNATFGAVEVTSGGAFTNNTGASAGAVTNAGTSSNGGTVILLVNTAGSFTNNFGGIITGKTTVSGGTVTNNATLCAVEVGAGGNFSNNTGAAAGAVTNAGSASNGGTLASLTNTAGSFTNNAGGTITGLTRVSGGTVTNNFVVTNVDVAAAAHFVNNLGATAGAVTNAGTASNGGTVASLANTGGTFSNSGTITGSTTVSGGTLINDGTITGTVAIYTGGILAGTGAIGGLTVGAGGILSPGPGFATVTVNGNVKFETGSTFRVETDPSGLADRMNATGAVTIEGGTLEILAGTGTYAPSTTYTIITAGSVTGAFDDVTTDLAFLTPTVIYGGTDVTLELDRNAVDFADVAETSNGRATATAVESLGAADTLYLAVLPLDAATADSAFGQLSGEIHGSLKTQLLQDGRFLRDAIVDRMHGAVPISPLGGASSWMTAFGATGHIAGDGNASGLTGNTGGVVVGADVDISANARLGAVLGYSHVSAGGDADADSYHAGIYAGADWGALTFTGGALYARNEVSTKRTVAFGTFRDRLKANYDSTTAQAFGDVEWRMRAGDVELSPFANLAYVYLDTDGFGEKGGAAALAGRSGRDDVTFATLGLRWAAEVPGEIPLTLSGMLGWRRAIGDLTPSSTLAFVSGGSPFMIEGLTVPRDTAVVEAGVTAQISKTARLKLSYSGEFASQMAAHAIKANLTVDF